MPRKSLTKKTITAPATKITHFKNGTQIQFRDDIYYVFDARGRKLGWTSRYAEAEYMALNGHVSYISELNAISELGLRTLWNDALDAGKCPLEDPDTGTQFLSLGDIVVLSAQPQPQPPGFKLDLLTEAAFWLTYRHNRFPTVLALTLAAKPLRLP